MMAVTPSTESEVFDGISYPLVRRPTLTAIRDEGLFAGGGRRQRFRMTRADHSRPMDSCHRPHKTPRTIRPESAIDSQAYAVLEHAEKAVVVIQSPNRQSRRQSCRRSSMCHSLL